LDGGKLNLPTEDDRVYIITEYNLENNSSTVRNVFRKKDKDLAKKEVDKLNALYERDENVDFKLEAYYFYEEEEKDDD
jgi:hypothetical protein